jgi:hypothetical protein
MPSSKIRAGIADNALVVSLFTADVPRIWRADLSQLLTAALEVQDNQGKYTLVMKRGGAAAEDIGTFSNKDDAIEALQVITDTLLHGNGNGISVAPSPKKSGGWFKKLLKVVGCIIAVVFVLLVFLSIFGPRPPAGYSRTSTPPVQTGVPTPADQILGK